MLADCSNKVDLRRPPYEAAYFDMSDLAWGAPTDGRSSLVHANYRPPSARLARSANLTKRSIDAMPMTEIELQDYARQLLEAHGANAVVEAAQKASAFEQQGQKEEAETWRHIEAAIKLIRGPHES
jgi:hypothetical protein